MNKFKKYCIVLSSIVMIISVLTNVYAINYHYSNKVNKNKIDLIKSEYTKKSDKLILKSNEEDITNILLIGSDARKTNEVGRSDAMMILTIDEKNKSIKLTSLARDTLVKIPGYDYEKLTHAYAYGKEKLLLDTIEYNFKIKINDYVSINFNSFIELVDSLGGIEVDINKSDISHLNDVIANSFKVSSSKYNEEPQYIRNSGKQLLNGYQTLAYSRIRKLDTIYNRDERQREVLSIIANKLSNMPVSSYPSIVNSILPYVDINMSIPKIIELAIKSKELYNYDIKQLEFPLKDYRYEAKLAKNNSFVVKWDKVENIKELQNFIYEK